MYILSLTWFFFVLLHSVPQDLPLHLSLLKWSEFCRVHARQPHLDPWLLLPSVYQGLPHHSSWPLSWKHKFYTSDSAQSLVLLVQEWANCVWPHSLCRADPLWGWSYDSSQRQYINDWECLCFNKTLRMGGEIRISRNAHLSWGILFFFSTVEKGKTISSAWVLCSVICRPLIYSPPCF